MPREGEEIKISRLVTSATLRWRAIPGGPSSVEELMTVFHERLKQLLSEHADIAEFYMDPVAWMDLDPTKITD
jgi:hypothetical protein